MAMFTHHSNTTEEDFFANINYSKNIECIIPTAELLVNFRSNGLRTKKQCYVYAEKMEFKGLIQLRITEKCDQRRMYITTVDSTSFNELKHNQSLHVTFSGFIENLVRILQDCQTGKLEIGLVQLVDRSQSMPITQNPFDDGINYSDSILFELQFIEMRVFKNLVHLSLPSRLAPLNVVLFYMNSILDAMQKKMSAHEHGSQHMQQELEVRLRTIDNLNEENAKLRETVLETSRNLNLRHSEEIQQMHENLRKESEKRQTDSERNRKTIASLQAQLENLNRDISQLQAEKTQEHRHNATLNEDLVNIRASMTTAREHNEKLRAEISALKNMERKNEMHLNDARKHIGELQDRLKKYDKIKAELSAEVEAEKKISHTKRQALEMATEEISKANEIILKQSQELIKCKRTIGWRTEVALEQEKAINEKDRLLQLCQDETRHQRQTIESLRQQIPHQLDSMRKFANSLEMKYEQQINALRESLKRTSEKENNPPRTSLSNRRN